MNTRLNTESIMLEENKTKQITNILDIVDIKLMQNVQDFFAKTLDISLVSIYKNSRLTVPSNSTEFCLNYARRTPIGISRCAACHLELEKAVIKEHKSIIYDCHAGLSNFAAPIFVEDQYLACVIGGQKLTKPVEVDKIKIIAKTLGHNEDEYLAQMKKLKIFSAEQFKAIADLICSVINSVAGIAYANSQLKKMGLDYKIPRNIKVEEWFFKNYGNAKRSISTREYEILKLLVQGKSNTEIATELFISTNTVKAHVSSIIDKFEVEDRVQVAVKAIREGLI